MNFINEYGLALGWTLIHMAWITFSIALFVQLVRLVIRSPRINYVLGMVSMLSLPVIAMAILGSQVDFGIPTDPNASGGLVQLVQTFVGAEELMVLAMGSWIDRHMDWVLLMWFAGMLSFIVRLLFGYTSLVGFRHSIQPMSDYWNVRFESIFKEFNIKANVLFGSSKRVEGPMTFGFVKPMILLPIGLVNALSVDEVEAIIRHELAHIARHDYLFKMIQSTIESLFYYTPGTWWLTKMIDIDREQCCDDYAIRSGSSEAAYIKALYKVNTFNTLESQLALGFGKEKNQLLNRVKRILKQPQEKANIMGRLIIPIALIIVVAGVSINATIKDNQNAEAEVVMLFPESRSENMTVAQVDTTRRKSKSVIKSKDNGKSKSYSITREDGEIKEMKVNGKKIAPEDFHKHEDEMIHSLLSDGMHFDFNADGFEEQVDPMKSMIEKIENELELMGDSLGFGVEERIQSWGKQFEENEKWEEYEEKMAEWGESFGESFGKDFGKEISEWSDQFGNAFSFNLDTEGLESWGKEIEKRVEEYRAKHPEKFHQDRKGEWQINEDNITFEDTEEMFGEGWTNELTEGISKMMEGFNIEMPLPAIPPVPPVMGNMPAPPTPPSINNVPSPWTRPRPPSERKEMKELKAALIEDGFFKERKKVSFKMNEKELKINGKTQSDQVYNRYKEVMDNHFGTGKLYDIDIKVEHIQPKVTMKGTYRI